MKNLIMTILSKHFPNDKLVYGSTKQYDAVYLNKENKETKFQFLRVKKVKDCFRISIKSNDGTWSEHDVYAVYEIENYIEQIKNAIELGKKESSFISCCHLYEQCSDARKCLNKRFEQICNYNKNSLKKGIIFYGKNKNAGGALQ